MSTYTHKYPMTCPHCQADLTKENACLAYFSIAGRTESFPSQLEGDGSLIDVDDLIANGYHSDTECATCSESLAGDEILE